MSNESLFSIYSNNFHSKSRPLPVWNFEVEFITKDNDVTLTDTLNRLSNVVETVSIPEKTMLTTTTAYYGLELSIPTRFQNTNELTITFYENEDMSTFKQLYNAFIERSINFNDYIIDEHTAENPNSYQLYYSPFDIIIRYKTAKNTNTDKKMSEDESTIERYVDCIVTNVSTLDFDYQSNEAAIFSVTFVYNHIKH